MNVLESLGPFFLLLGVLVFFHELGHFAVAKWLGVTCERFAIGFGPALLRYRYGETEYVLNWLPLGGYVKMLGESPDDELSVADSRRSFYGQSPLRRTAIALAGPVMNLLLSIVVIAAVVMTAGWPAATSRIGSVAPDSAAAQAGLQGGDRIVALDGEEVTRWQDLVQRIRDAGGRPLALQVERGQERFALNVTPRPMEPGGTPMLGIDVGVPKPVLAFPDEGAPALAAGLRSGDVVASVNGVPVRDRYQLEEALAAAAPGAPLELQVQRAQGEQLQDVRVQLPAGEGPGAAPAQPGASPAQGWSLARLGAVEIDFEVGAVAPASPAKRAGLQAGDLFLSAAGQPVRSREQLSEALRAPGAPVAVEVLRRGERVALSLEPPAGVDADPLISLGARVARPEASGGEQVYEVVRNPFVALYYGGRETWSYFKLTADSLKRLVTREIGVGNLTGPIGIGEIAAESFQQDFQMFLRWLCIISVNLAIINLLPIPVLDGGHILFAAAEAVRGGPLGRRAREVAQTMGLSVVIMLMGLAFWNDLSRSWPRILSFFQGLL